jgi:hypothetical protein
MIIDDRNMLHLPYQQPICRGTFSFLLLGFSFLLEAVFMVSVFSSFNYYCVARIDRIVARYFVDTFYELDIFSYIIIIKYLFWIGHRVFIILN